MSHFFIYNKLNIHFCESSPILYRTLPLEMLQQLGKSTGEIIKVKPLYFVCYLLKFLFLFWFYFSFGFICLFLFVYASIYILVCIVMGLLVNSLSHTLHNSLHMSLRPRLLEILDLIRGQSSDAFVRLSVSV